MAKQTAPERISCQCTSFSESPVAPSFESFSALRERCSVLRSVLIPDAIWPLYAKFSQGQELGYQTQPLYYMAYKHGVLSRFTETIHHLKLHLDRCLSRQYLCDLPENWLKESEEVARFRKFRILKGRWAELLFAELLLSDDRQIDGMEAFGDNFDVSAFRRGGPLIDFEVKNIGVDEQKYVEFLEACENGALVCSEDIDDKADYLLYRVWESTKKLTQSRNKKFAVVVFDDFEDFKFGISHMNWRKPKFFNQTRDNVMFNLERNIGASRKRSIELDVADRESEIGSAIQKLDEIWFCELTGGFEIRVRHFVSI